MERPFLFSILLVSLLCSCTTHHNSPTVLASNFIQRQKIVAMTTEQYPQKKAETISVYTKEKSPHTAYKIIGIASVSNFNLFGIKRKETTLTDMIKKLAASIGGDGLINIQYNSDKIEASVIAYQKILI